jgi:hypothetical protein
MNSPYLKEDGRLGDVIAAIQALATYKFYKLDFEGWADRISADTSRAKHWQCVFEEHPEFFRLDGGRQRASLVWRRQYPKRYDVDTLKEITREQFEALDEASKTRISRTPLSADDIKTLIDTAIDLHSRAIEGEKHRHWFRPLAVQALAALLGAIVGGWASNYFRPTTPTSIAPQVQAPLQRK